MLSSRNSGTRTMPINASEIVLSFVFAEKVIGRFIIT
jgi:hypothetical protein